MPEANLAFCLLICLSSWLQRLDIGGRVPQNEAVITHSREGEEEERGRIKEDVKVWMEWEAGGEMMGTLRVRPDLSMPRDFHPVFQHVTPSYR